MEFAAIVYCRIFLNRQTAAAHELIFQKIHEIVFADTGENLTWRHLHSATIDGEIGILHFVLDQHGGQAKGKLFLATHQQAHVRGLR